VSIGDEREAVLRRLGTPVREIATGDALDPRVEYPGLEVAFWDGGTVAHLRSTGATHCTLSGVCPGAPGAAALARLGRPPAETGAEVKDGRYEFPVSADTCWLEVYVAGQVVESLAIGCQP
jgi:hypothetical protein